MAVRVGRAYWRSDECENSSLVLPSVLGSPSVFRLYMAVSRRQERPSVNASSSFSAPQPFATRPEDAVGNRVRISMIAVPARLESQEQYGSRNAIPSVDRGVTMSLNPTCCWSDCSTVREDGTMVGSSNVPRSGPHAG